MPPCIASVAPAAFSLAHHQCKLLRLGSQATINVCLNISCHCHPYQSLQDVELVQFMGKDNVPFHTVIFPATLLGTQASGWAGTST